MSTKLLGHRKLVPGLSQDLNDDGDDDDVGDGDDV